MLLERFLDVSTYMVLHRLLRYWAGDKIVTESQRQGRIKAINSEIVAIQSIALQFSCRHNTMVRTCPNAIRIFKSRCSSIIF